MPSHFSTRSGSDKGFHRGSLSFGAFLGCCNLASRRSPNQIPYPRQVECRGGEGEYPVYAISAPMSRLAERSDRFEPTEDLFNTLALSLTPNIPRGAASSARRSRYSVEGRLYMPHEV